MTFDYWALLQETSRTFYLSIRQLPKSTGNALCLAYLLLRVSDYLEDNTLMNPGQKADRLLMWADMITSHSTNDQLSTNLNDFLDGSADAKAAVYAKDLLEQVYELAYPVQQAIRLHVFDSTCGMARWALKGPEIKTEEDLDDYMHEVAGRVGYLSTTIFACYSKTIRGRLDQLIPLSKQTGLALQTVNVIRGLRKDFERGWIYVPQNYCNQYQISPQQLFDPNNQESALKVVNLLANKADRHLDSAIKYFMLIPPTMHRLRLACAWPLCFALKTLAVNRHNPQSLTDEVKISRSDVKKIIKDTTLFGWSNSWMRGYCDRLRKPVIADAR